jgi:hypothetical protein
MYELHASLVLLPPDSSNPKKADHCPDNCPSAGRGSLQCNVEIVQISVDRITSVYPEYDGGPIGAISMARRALSRRLSALSPFPCRCRVPRKPKPNSALKGYC